MKEREWLTGPAMGLALAAPLLMMLIVSALVLGTFKRTRECLGHPSLIGGLVLKNKSNR